MSNTASCPLAPPLAAAGAAIRTTDLQAVADPTPKPGDATTRGGPCRRPGRRGKPSHKTSATARLIRLSPRHRTNHIRGVSSQLREAEPPMTNLAVTNELF